VSGGGTLSVASEKLLNTSLYLLRESGPSSSITLPKSSIEDDMLLCLVALGTVFQAVKDCSSVKVSVTMMDDVAKGRTDKSAVLMAKAECLIERSGSMEGAIGLTRKERFGHLKSCTLIPIHPPR
jgi:hypothetical protein